MHDHAKCNEVRSKESAVGKTRGAVRFEVGVLNLDTNRV